MAAAGREHAIELPLDRAAALAALARTAEEWGAELEPAGDGGHLTLPVTAGLRRGWARARVTVAPEAGGSRVVLAVEESEYRLHTPAVVVLLLALAGSAVAVLWPLFPRLLAAAPLGLALALGGWFLIVSRLTTAGPEEFLAQLAAEAEGNGPP
ncbi:MAG TPA: hypothetical protein VF121_19185 [Thermoanaerobaculia bacterium]|nr:hypothetical protein [Thermoanaerobaculia bacterium]